MSLGIPRLFAGEPTEVALTFLRRIQDSTESADVTNGLAISTFCGPEKRKVIDARWKSRASWLKTTSFEISPLREKIDDHLAAVLVAASTKSSPESATVIALGLVKRGDGGWQVAPLEGSFDNAGLGFGSVLKSRVTALEEWMALEKISETIILREKERAIFRQSMEGVVDPKKLKIEQPELVLQEFLKAAHAGETEQLLVWQGILERDQLPERDWDRDMSATQRGMNTDDPRSAWRTLKSNKVMKVIVDGHGDAEDADYLVAFYSTFKTDPRNESLNPIRFRLFMTDRGWRIKLPPFFAYDDQDLATHRQAFDEAFDWEDRNITKEMGYFFEDENKQLRGLEPKAVLEGVVADLKSGNLHSFLKRHYRELGKIADEEGEAAQPNKKGEKDDIAARQMERYGAALAWWGLALGREETANVKIQKVYQEGDLSLGVLQIGMNNSGWDSRYLGVWMAKNDDGWMVLPGNPWPLPHSMERSLTGSRQKISGEFASDLLEFRRETLTAMFENFGIEDPGGVNVDEVVGGELLKDWMKVAVGGSIIDLAKKSAIRMRPDQPEKFMRDLGYLRSSLAAAQVPEQILGSAVSGRFRGFSLMIDMGGEIEPSFPLFIVVPTKTGHAILVDIELPLETNKGLQLLNDDRIKSLTAELPDEDLASIVILRDGHQKIARPAWEKWNLEQASKSE